MRRHFESEISMRISKFHYLSQSYQRTDGHPFEPYVYFKVIILMEIGDIKMYSSIRQMVFWFSINDDLFEYIFMSQPESFVAFNLIKNERGSIFPFRVNSSLLIYSFLPIRFVYSLPFRERGAVFIQMSSRRVVVIRPGGLFHIL